MVETLAHVVARHAAQAPQRPALVVAGTAGGGRAAEAIGYAELDARARRVAAQLREHCPPGGQALLMYRSTPDVVVGLLGCMRAGVAAICAPVPHGPRHHLAPATGIAVESAASVVLTDVAELPAVHAWAGQRGLRRLVLLATGDGSSESGADSGPDPVLQPAGDLAALVDYRFGPSGPQPVVVRQQGLLDDLARIGRALGLAAGTRVGGWLAPGDRLRLVGLTLAPLLTGGTTVVMPDHEFPGRPEAWLDLVDREEVEVTAAPGWAYRRCVQAVRQPRAGRLDLSRLRVALVGPDPVEADTTRRFARHFAAAGFREAAFVPLQRIGQSALLSVGGGRTGPAPGADTDVLERSVLRRAAGGQGSAAQTGRIPDQAGANRLLAFSPQTGEPLPEGLAGEESLQLPARAWHPVRIERAAAALHPSFGPGRTIAFTVSAADDRRVVILIQELDRVAAGLDLAALAMRVRVGLIRGPGVVIGGVVFVRPGQVRVTAGGEIRRALMRELFVADALETLFEELDGPVRRRCRAS